MAPPVAPRPQAPPFDPIQQQYQSELQLLNQIQALYQQQLDQQVARQRAAYAAIAQQLSGIAPQIEGIASRQAQASTEWAKGFSDTAAQLANQSTGGAQAEVAGFGMPTGNLNPVGASMGNALYGEFGVVPATGISNYGTAAAAAAAQLPATALLSGERDISRMMSEFNSQNLLPLQIERLKLAAGLPERRAQARETKRAETLDLYKAGLLTQREFARRMGVKGWKRFPNVIPGTGSDQELTFREVGGSLFAIDPATGRAKMVVQGPGPKPDVRTSGGYIWEKDPNTGQWNPVGGTGPAPPRPSKPSSYQHLEVGGKTYVFDPNTGLFYDPRTGKPTAPRGKTGARSKYTPLQLQGFKGDSHSLAEDFRTGIPANQTKDGVAIPARSYQEAIQEALRSGIPLDVFIPVLNRYYKPGQGGRPRKPQPGALLPASPTRTTGPDIPAPSGGRSSRRTNIAFVQAAGFNGDPAVVQVIVDEARRQRLDPYAVLSVALSEGGLRYGAVGDNGDSHGPFQLNRNGALGNRSPSWANSPAGIRWAIRKMAQVGARGLTGREAIDVIINRFERPAHSYLDKAWGYYNQLVGAAQTVEV